MPKGSAEGIEGSSVTLVLLNFKTSAAFVWRSISGLFLIVTLEMNRFQKQ